MLSESESISIVPAIIVSKLGKNFRVYPSPLGRVKELASLGIIRAHQPFQALRDVSFTVKKGEAVGIIGTNGSGKSTLLQLICGIMAPTTGEIKVSGKISALLELGVGFDPEFTGKENVYISGCILGLSDAQIDERYDDIVSFADIGPFISQPVKTYSSGMYVRLAFSVAVHVEPDILVVDEALAVGDIVFQNKCFEKFEELRRKQVTILMVSHDMNAVKSLCDRSLYLQKGKLVADGTPVEVEEQYYFDTRAQQQKFSLTHLPIVPKSPIGRARDKAFGTDQGAIMSACFEKNGEPAAQFSCDDIVRIRVEVEYGSDILNPSLSVVVNDKKAFAVAGSYFTLDSRSEQDPHSVGCCVSFKARLAPGLYAIMLRLEDRRTKENFFPIDKQVGALVFEVVDTRVNRFLAPADLGMIFNCEVLDDNVLQSMRILE